MHEFPQDIHEGEKTYVFKIGRMTQPQTVHLRDKGDGEVVVMACAKDLSEIRMVLALLLRILSDYGDEHERLDPVQHPPTSFNGGGEADKRGRTGTRPRSL